ncbi:MAG: 3-deoxy-7-phosphoheptulonate synthase [Myxococcaceae bacterium]|nr:3-deoxy-7-phosphoheptulonate synthase [Myxococcaceae bacterium]
MNCEAAMGATGPKRVLREPGEATHRVRFGGVEVGGDFVVIAGPCALETQEQVDKAAQAVKSAGGHALRGGAFKPRTSPYTFQGLGEPGLPMLAEAGRKLRLPVVSEIMDAAQLPSVLEYVDVLQVGARNMQNFSLLRALSKIDRPVLLKRGFGSTIDEWILAAEYLLDGGNDQVMLCERGIRTFDTTLRNTLDLAGMAYVKQRVKLPVLVDPSHSTGVAALVTPMALAAAAAGADGLLVEVHPTPETALCDGPQALRPSEFDALMKGVSAVLHATGRRLAEPRPLAAVGGTR